MNNNLIPTAGSGTHNVPQNLFQVRVGVTMISANGSRVGPPAYGRGLLGTRQPRPTWKQLEHADDAEAKASAAAAPLAEEISLANSCAAAVAATSATAAADRMAAAEAVQMADAIRNLLVRRRRAVAAAAPCAMGRCVRSAAARKMKVTTRCSACVRRHFLFTRLERSEAEAVITTARAAAAAATAAVSEAAAASAAEAMTAAASSAMAAA